jgi:hypothetical protein
MDVIRDVFVYNAHCYEKDFGPLVVLASVEGSIAHQISEKATSAGI